MMEAPFERVAIEPVRLANSGFGQGLRPKKLACVLVLIIAVGLRFHAIGFGLPGLYDPDELMFELGAIHMLSHATIDPGWYGHPATTTMYVLAIADVSTYLVGHTLGWFANLRAFSDAIYTNPGWVILPGRWAIALFGVALVWQTMRLARMLGDEHAALAAGAVVAVSPLLVSWSQVIRSDVMGMCFVMLCLCASLRAYRIGGWRRDALAALWLGTAIATKWPMVEGGLGMVGLLAYGVFMHGLPPGRAVRRVTRFAGMAVLALLLVSPYLAIHHTTVVRNLQGEVQLHHLEATGGSFIWNLRWYGGEILHNGVGVAGFALAVAGIFGMVIRGRRDDGVWLIGPALIAMIVIIGDQHLVWSRWAVPLVPLLAVPAGQAWSAVARAAATSFGAVARCGLFFAGVAAVCMPLVLTDMAHATARSNDTRQRASVFAIAHIPPGSRVLIEHFGFDLYQQPWQILFPMGTNGCVDARALLHGKVDNAAIDGARSGRSNIDYGTVPRALDGSCRADYAIITQFDRYAAERAYFPQQYQAYRDLLAGSQQLAIFAPAAGVSFGPITRVVRFDSAVRRTGAAR